MPLTTLDLGLVQAIIVGSTEPTNTKVLWYDTTVNYHKYYSTIASAWVKLAGDDAQVVWQLNGNAVESEKFIGTTNDFDFPIRVNDVEVARFNTSHNLLIGQPVATGMRMDIKQGASTWSFGAYTAASSVAAIYANQAIPAVNNYTLISTGTTTTLNAVLNTMISVNDVVKEFHGASHSYITQKTFIGATTTPTAYLDITGSSAALASLRIRSGTTPSSPNTGDIWLNNTTGFNFQGGAVFNASVYGVTESPGDNSLKYATTAFVFAAIDAADSPLTTKGDLYTYSTVNTRLAVGANATLLIADSSSATGNKWVAVSGDGTIDVNGVFTLTAPVSIAKGGTNSIAALNSNRIMVSSAGAIVENAAQTATYLSYYSVSGLPTGSINMKYDGTGLLIGNPTSTGRRVDVKQDTAVTSIGSYISDTTFSAIYFNQSSPSGSNYSIIGNGTDLYLRSNGNTYLIAGGVTNLLMSGVDSVFQTGIKVGFGGITPTTFVDIAGSSTSNASLRIRQGTAPSLPNAGDIWFTSSNQFHFEGNAVITGGALINGATSTGRAVDIKQDTAFWSIGSYTDNTTYAALYSNQASPGTNNYTIISNGTSTYIQGSSDVRVYNGSSINTYLSSTTNYTTKSWNFGGANTPTALVDIDPSTTSTASLRLRSSIGVNPTGGAILEGNFWWNGTNLNFRTGSSTVDLLSGGTTGALLTTKGDLFTYSTVNARLGVGANATIFMADSATTTGNKWIAAYGDWTIATTGVTTIGNGVVTDTKGALANKPAVTVVATTNQTLSGTPTIDGQLMVAGTSMPLLTAQTSGAENGPWIVQSGAWTRPTWYPSGGITQAFQFITTLVRLGATYQGSTWRMTTSGAITIDTTATTWVVTPFSISSSTITGLVPLSNGGSNANLTASNGGIVYSTASAMAILSGTATANQVLLSGSSVAPVWSTATYPATTTVNQILYSSSTNVIAGIITGNNGVLITSAGGIPTISSTIPSATQDNITRVGTLVSGATGAGFTIALTTSTVTGTLLTTNGGNGLTSWTQGDIPYYTSGTALSKLAKDTNATRYISNTGSSNAPAWAQIDLSNGVTGDLPFANLTQIAGLSVLGVTGSSTADVAAITAGSDGNVLRRSGTTLAFGAIDISSSNAVTNTLAVTNGGNGQSSYTNGQLLIGNTTGNTLTKATLTGTANQVIVTNGAGSITLSTPQDINTSSAPTFDKLQLGPSQTQAVTTALSLRGTNGTVNNAAHWYTSADQYPLLQILPFAHSNVSLNFDSYYSAGWFSSDANGNFQLAKSANLMSLNYSTAAAGAAVTWSTALSYNTSGNVMLRNSTFMGGNTTPTAFAHIAGSTTSQASICITAGAAPTSPNSGDMWNISGAIWHEGTITSKAGTGVNYIKTRGKYDASTTNAGNVTTTKTALATTNVPANTLNANLSSIHFGYGVLITGTALTTATFYLNFAGTDMMTTTALTSTVSGSVSVDGYIIRNGNTSIRYKIVITYYPTGGTAITQVYQNVVNTGINFTTTGYDLILYGQSGGAGAASNIITMQSFYVDNSGAPPQ